MRHCVTITYRKCWYIKQLRHKEAQNGRMCICRCVWKYVNVCLLWSKKSGVDKDMLDEGLDMYNHVCFLFMAVNLTKDYISMWEVKEIAVVRYFSVQEETTLFHYLYLSLSLFLGTSIFCHNFCVCSRNRF